MSRHGKSSRNVNVHGNAIGSTIVTGDSHASSMSYREAGDSTKATIVEALDKLHGILKELEMEPHLRRRVQGAIAEAKDELATADPNKEAVGSALDRLLQAAEKTGKLAVAAEKLRPHVAALAAWLGPHWHRVASWMTSTL